MELDGSGFSKSVSRNSDIPSSTVCDFLYKINIIVASIWLSCKLNDLTAHNPACCKAQIRAVAILHIPHLEMIVKHIDESSLA